MSRITNDIELTKQRQEHIAKYGIEKGFPVYMVKVMYDDIYLFFTAKARDEFMKKKEKEGYKCITQVKHVTDVTGVSFTTK